MTIQKCDRCKEEIKDVSKQYWLQLEEHDYSQQWYVENPAHSTKAQICVNCYKELWGDVM